MQSKDIPHEKILGFLAERQGVWTSLWYGRLGVEDVFHAFPADTPHKLIRAKMSKLVSKGYVGGCACGCRGDFEITDRGLELIGQQRTEPYTGY